MRLQSLQLHGFKSFADQTELEFRDGVTVIVGSNGCGKSNIADAIRWVLGEQRASAVRGSKMEEVIFQGTTRRRPHNFGEVILRFDNDRGRVPIPQREIEVARRVHREGGSEYSLNRNVCRLRDIHNLLRDTGLGSNAYAVIEAGMIETLLSDHAEERRTLFEEAAGIGRYKDSRQAAMRRLESAEADLTRLNDLVAEVESKVRSLSRQRRKAERHTELRARRLELEVWLASAELKSIAGGRETAETRRSELDEILRSAGVARTAAEARLEERRLEHVSLTQTRIATAARAEEVRSRLDAREREILVAKERGNHSELRVNQLLRERSEVETRAVALEQEIENLSAETAGHRSRLGELGRQLEVKGEQARSLRASVAQERAASDAAHGRARTLAREIATAEGERGTIERQIRELESRIETLATQEQELVAELERLAEQANLWEGRLGEVRERVARVSRAAEVARGRIDVHRSAEQSARETLRIAESELSRLTAQVEAREALENSYEGFVPGVAALMAARNRFPGVHGPLADYLQGQLVSADQIESYLGPLLQAVVVRDLAVARDVRRWFREEWEGRGHLLLLPLDALGTAKSPEAWVDVLLADLAAVDGDPLNEFVPGVIRVSPTGDIVDERGIVRLADRAAEQGILSRREALIRLRADRDAVAAQVAVAAAEVDARRQALHEAEEEAHRAEETRRVAQSEMHALEADAAAHEHHHTRLRRDREQVAATGKALQEAGETAKRQIGVLELRLADMSRAVAEATAAEDASRSRLAALEEEWERARDQESELRIEVARAEAELREADRRASAAEQARIAAGERTESIDREVLELRSTLVALADVRERAERELEGLFGDRDQVTSELANIDRELARIDHQLNAFAEEARASRRRESEAAEGRHALDLELAELRSRAERVVERLEVEWGRPWDALRSSINAPPEESEESWRAALRETTTQLEALGPVNMLAMEEHAEEDRRLDFLLEQRADLVKARDDLVTAIRQINRTAREVFVETFDAVRTNFHRVFQSLFQGGECDIWLADPDDPLESAVEIHASPKGKRTQRIHLLSGGERTLTALALLFALYLVKPSPFCVLDEVDAPLDESNVGRFIQLLQDFKAETQFIVITHNPQTMESADWAYGVTMQDPGVSSVVSVELAGGGVAENLVA